jgi:glycosyltransferase involved in cell wall biosynthesis
VTTIHQLVPAFSRGDAVGASVLRVRRTLRDLGFESEIFGDVIDPGLAHEARPAEDVYSGAVAADAFIYHFSIGAPMSRRVALLPAPRILMYHNITPPHYFRAVNPTVAYWLERGREELRMLAPRVDLVLGLSQFSLDEAAAAGSRRGAVVPAVDMFHLPAVPQQRSTTPEILFVGRIAPNKCHQTLIRALAALRATDEPEATLVLAGHAHDCLPYLEALRRLIRDLGLDGAVTLTGERVSDAELSALYARAWLFACASEHEGFGVPLLEAMSFDVPVLALSSGAVPEVVGDAAMLLGSDDPLLWAAAMARLLRDEPLREGLVAAGRSRLQLHTEETLRTALRDALQGIGLRSATAAKR